MNIKVKINAERPDFRVFATYFFGDDLYNYDSDGDCETVTSKNWTELYMRSRKHRNMHFYICLDSENPLIFEVSSETFENTNIIAYFLAKETKGEIVTENNTGIPLKSLIENMEHLN